MKQLFGKVGGFLLAGIRHVTTALAGLLTIPLVARTLGADALGLWALLGMAAFALGLADLGLGVAVQRAAARGDVAGTRNTIRVAVGVILVVAPLLAIVSYAFLLDLPDLSPALASDAKHATIVAFGRMVTIAEQAASDLAQAGIEVENVDPVGVRLVARSL